MSNNWESKFLYTSLVGNIILTMSLLNPTEPKLSSLRKENVENIKILSSLNPAYLMYFSVLALNFATI